MSPRLEFLDLKPQALCYYFEIFGVKFIVSEVIFFLLFQCLFSILMFYFPDRQAGQSLIQGLNYVVLILERPLKQATDAQGSFVIATMHCL